MTHTNLFFLDTARWHLDARRRLRPKSVPGHETVGFKLFPEHVARGGGRGGGGGGGAHVSPTLDFYERLLADPRVKKIILRRENRLATCASVMRSSVTGSFLRTNLDHVKVSIKPSDLHAFIRGYDAYYAYLRERLAGQQWLETTYERVAHDAETELRCACEWVGVKVAIGAEVRDAEVERRVVKQTSLQLSEGVENFDRLRAAFAGTDTAADFIE